MSDLNFFGNPRDSHVRLTVHVDQSSSRSTRPFLPELCTRCRKADNTCVACPPATMRRII